MGKNKKNKHKQNHWQQHYDHQNKDNEHGRMMEFQQQKEAKQRRIKCSSCGDTIDLPADIPISLTNKSENIACSQCCKRFNSNTTESVKPKSYPANADSPGLNQDVGWYSKQERNGDKPVVTIGEDCGSKNQNFKENLASHNKSEANHDYKKDCGSKNQNYQGNPSTSQKLEINNYKASGSQSQNCQGNPSTSQNISEANYYNKDSGSQSQNYQGNSSTNYHYNKYSGSQSQNYQGNSSTYSYCHKDSGSKSQNYQGNSSTSQHKSEANYYKDSGSQSQNYQRNSSTYSHCHKDSGSQSQNYQRNSSTSLNKSEANYYKDSGSQSQNYQGNSSTCSHCHKDSGSQSQNYQGNSSTSQKSEANYHCNKDGGSKSQNNQGNSSTSQNKTEANYHCNKDGGSKSQNDQGNSSTSQHKSPANHHNSKCLEKVRCTWYCMKCKLWLCDKCASLQHSKNGCIVIPHATALQDKKQECENTIKGTLDSLESTVKEFEEYNLQLNADLMLMRAAFENMEKKKKLVETYIQNGKNKVQKLHAEQAKFPNPINLHDSLALFQNIDSKATEAQSWISEEGKSVRDRHRIERISKDMLFMTFECLQSLKIEGGTQSQIFVFKQLPTGKILSELKADGGRICMQSLTPRQTIIEGTRLLPLECITSCMDNNSRLAFLDLSMGGQQQGRVYVRLTGDTHRGRQFLKLCTGETGPCYRGTRFHRIWWKGLDGEHVWGGDIEKGDGSGGHIITENNNSDNNVPQQLARQVPITAGLVTGRYEKDYISSIFRIYTKGAQNVKADEVFGQVEFGLNILEKTTKLSNITDLTIDDCGIVLEA